MSKAISSYKVYLCTYEVEKTTGNNPTDKYKYKLLIEIKDFPDMGGTPEMLDCTTTSDAIQCFIPGIQMLDNGGLEFTANYTKANYDKLVTQKTSEENKDGNYAVVYGGKLDGNGQVVTNNGEGAFVFNGKMSAYPKGGSVNSVVDLAISIAPSTTIEYIKDENTAVLPRDQSTTTTENTQNTQNPENIENTGNGNGGNG